MLIMESARGFWVGSSLEGSHSQLADTCRFSLAFSRLLRDFQTAATFHTSRLWNGQPPSSRCRFSGFQLAVQCTPGGAKEVAKDSDRGVANTLEGVSQIIAKQLTIDPSAIKPDSKLGELGVDSLDMVEFLMSIEDQFNISLPEEGAEKVTTVQEAVNLIKELKPNNVPK